MNALVAATLRAREHDAPLWWRCDRCDDDSPLTWRIRSESTPNGYLCPDCGAKLQPVPGELLDSHRSDGALR